MRYLHKIMPTSWILIGFKHEPGTMQLRLGQFWTHTDIKLKQPGGLKVKTNMVQVESRYVQVEAAEELFLRLQFWIQVPKFCLRVYTHVHIIWEKSPMFVFLVGKM